MIFPKSEFKKMPFRDMKEQNKQEQDAIHVINYVFWSDKRFKKH